MDDPVFDRRVYNLIELRDQLEKSRQAGEPLPGKAAADLFYILTRLASVHPGRGKPSQWDSCHQDLVDYWRYEAVKEARRRGAKGETAYEVVADVGRTFWGDVTDHAVKASHKRVKKRLKTEPGRYDRLQGLSAVDGFRRRWDAAIMEIVQGQAWPG